VQLRGLYETRVALLMNLRSASMPPDPVALHSLSLLYKFVRTFGKFFRRVQQVEVARFVDLPLCDDLVLYYWEKVVQANSSAELIEGMLVRTKGIGDSLMLIMVRLGNRCVPRSHSRGRDGSVQGKSRPMVPGSENKDRTYFERVPELFTSLFCSHNASQPFPRISWRLPLHSLLLVSCRLFGTTLKVGWRTRRSGSTPRTRTMNSGSSNYG
jgi:hypothetical protein